MKDIVIALILVFVCFLGCVWNIFFLVCDLVKFIEEEAKEIFKR